MYSHKEREFRRVRLIQVTKWWLEELANVDMIIYKDGTTSKMDVFPDGAEIIGIEWDIARDSLVLAVEHESYDPLWEGAQPPFETYVTEDKVSRHYYSEDKYNEKEDKKTI